jgi:hypothetical protein
MSSIIGALTRLQLLRQHRVPFGRREQRDQQLEPPPQITAGHLAGAGFHVDIAAGAVEIKSQGIFERLAGVFTEELGFFADITLAAEQLEFKGGIVFDDPGLLGEAQVKAGLSYSFSWR